MKKIVCIKNYIICNFKFKLEMSMSKIKEKLSQKIPDWRYNYRQLLDEKGNKVISEVTIGAAYEGMRGVKGMICDTSSVTADKGLHIR
ncbi:hypothetical protein EB155_09765, partial [archaeon]|nr:hypothetical protein [archaeon]